MAAGAALAVAAAALALPCGGGRAAAADLGTLTPPLTATGTLDIDAVTPLPRGRWAAAAWLNYAAVPLLWRYGDGTWEPALTHRLGLDAVVAVGLGRLVDVGVDVPVVLRQGGGAGYQLGELDGSGLGDVRLSGRLSLLPPRIFPVGAALRLDVGLPSGRAALLMGSGRPTLTPQLLLALPLRGTLWSARVSGHWARGESLGGLPFGSRLGLALGARRPLEVGGRALVAQAVLRGESSAAPPFGAGQSGVELLVGATGRLGADLDVTAALGGSLGGAPGLPSGRLLLGLGWRPPAPDSDGDGVADSNDDCPASAEDYNHFADLDGCPDAALAAVAAGILPPPPAPPPDADHDGVADAYDHCPDAPETINGVADGDGCPDAGVAATRYRTAQDIEVLQPIQFEAGGATLRADSLPVLDQVALQLLAHPEVQLVRVEGHTDSQGAAAANLRLSQRRAAAVVQYLVERGVVALRLQAVGLGETQPLDSDLSAAGRARNRRVAFVILRAAAPP